MDILNLVDQNFLYMMGVVLVVFFVFYFTAARKQNAALKKVDVSIKHQEKTNSQLGLIISELRRSNRLLAELANIEMSEESFVGANDSQQVPYEGSQNNVATSSEPQFKLYVGNIDYSATETELSDYFSQYGKVEFVNIPVNRYTGKARGFGFVTFVSKEDAERAMSLHGSDFKGRQIQVNFAKERDIA